MSYEKQTWNKKTWSKGQKHLEDQLNHIEEGIVNAGSGGGETVYTLLDNAELIYDEAKSVGYPYYALLDYIPDIPGFVSGEVIYDIQVIVTGTYSVLNSNLIYISNHYCAMLASPGAPDSIMILGRDTSAIETTEISHTWSLATNAGAGSLMFCYAGSGLPDTSGNYLKDGRVTVKLKRLI